MFDKVKEVFKSSETVNELNSIILETKQESQKLTSELRSMKDEFKSFKTNVHSEIADINDSLSKFATILKDTVRNFDDFNKQFNGHIEDLRIQKNKMLEVVYEKATAGLNKEIERLKLDVGRYNELKDTIHNLSFELNTIKEDLKKFHEISNSIRNQDFELVKFAKQVENIEKEKSDLLRKIDSLQHLISRERRNKY